jgi:tetratricopeptide (TPR) repeat protein
MTPDGAQSSGAASPARDAVDAYQQSGELTVLEQAIRSTRAALRQQAGDPLHAGEQVALRIDLAVLLSSYGYAVGDGEATSEGLRLFAEAAAAANGAAETTAAQEASRALASWTSVLVSEHDRTGAAGLLTEARGLAGQALDAAVPGTTQRSDALSALAGVLIREYQDTGRLPAIDEAVTALRESVALAERGDDPDPETGRDPDLDAKIHKLAVALNLRASDRVSAEGQDSLHGKEGRDPPRDHVEAVALLRAVLDRTPAGSPQRPDRLAALATMLHDGHEEFSTDTAEEALALSAQAHATARGPKRALFAADLAACLLGGVRSDGDKTILDRAVILLADAAGTPSLDAPALAEVDTRLGAVLTTRYVQFGDPADLDAALEALGRARARDVLRGQDHVQALSDLGAALHELHIRSGQPAQLQEAIEVLEAGRREAGSSRAGVFRGLLANLGTVYLGHHEVFGDRESLDSAIECLDEAVAGPGRTHSAWQVSRGQAYQARFLMTSKPADLERALSALRESVAIADRRSATSRAAQGNLAEALRLRALLGQPDGPGDRQTAWADAASAAEAALDGAAFPDERALRLSNLGTLLMDRHDVIPDLEVRCRAIACLREAVGISRPEDPRRAIYLSNLASVCFTLGLDDGSAPMSPPAIARARELLREAAATVSAAPQHRVWAAYTWAQLACKSDDLDEGIEAFGVAIALIPEMAGQRLARRDREQHLAGLSELARDAAACALEYGDPARAVEFLEHGRGILISDLLHDVHDESVLTDQQPDLAGRLQRAEAELAALTSGEQMGTAIRRQQLAADLSAVIVEIRSCGVPELADFRRPPSLAELADALPGPVVVVNVSDYRSDALILTGGKLRVLECPELTPVALHEHLARFDEALAGLAAAADVAAADAAWPELEDAFHDASRWLWNVLARRVLEQLGVAEEAGDPREALRIWWVPTGELARFPLHAAGYHGSADSPPQSVFSRVVSSYATSLTSLRRAVTSRASGHPPDGVVPGVLAVAMPHTPALGPAGDLPSATAEMAMISRRFPMAVTLAGAGATRAATLAAIKSASIAHFGCHATIVPADPSRGRLLVHDGAILITELQALPAWPRTLAFLSACDTASVRGDIPDEFVHLASAFQVIGFEHVIGTAWQVPDDIALAVTEGFYAGAWDAAAGRNADPAAVLHASIAAALASDPLSPFPWAYVHYGADNTSSCAELELGAQLALSCSSSWSRRGEIISARPGSAAASRGVNWSAPSMRRKAARLRRSSMASGAPMRSLIASPRASKAMARAGEPPRSVSSRLRAR